MAKSNWNKPAFHRGFNNPDVTLKDKVPTPVRFKDVGKPWSAKYDGFCPSCRLDINVGDKVTWRSNKYAKKVVHKECFDYEQ